jgi:hypothetical protein
MLQSNRRHILFFDLAMAPYPSDAPPISLSDLIPALKARVESGEAIQVIDNERRVIRMSAISDVRSPKGEAACAILFNLGDRAKADPGFTNFETGAVRVAKRRAGEAGGLSVHAVVSLVPTQTGGHLYRMLYEDVSGFGRSLIQDFLRAQFRIICDEQGAKFRRDDQRELKTRPMVELHGHASTRLRDSLAAGRLLHVELIDHMKEDFDFDEQGVVKTVRRDLSFSVSNALPHGEALSFVERVKAWAKANGYETMRLRWKEESVQRPLTAKVDTARLDAGDAFFVRTTEVTLNGGLADVSEAMSDELIDKICALLD